MRWGAAPGKAGNSSLCMLNSVPLCSRLLYKSPPEAPWQHRILSAGQHTGMVLVRWS